jgi:hypothetical protein
MNSSLRKSHIRIWVIAAVIMPIFIILSIIGRPDFPINQAGYNPTSIQALPNIIKPLETNKLKINLRAKEKTIGQLEIFVKEPLKSASTTIYYLENKGKGRFIGSIGSKGLYRFPIDKSIRGIVLYDPIKKRDIQLIEI